VPGIGAASTKEVVEEVDGVGQVDAPIVVRVGGIRAPEGVCSAKQRVEDGHAVAQVHLRVGAGIAA
jgi:hypothetical protein